jgi:transcription elongation factor Elf1
MLSAYTQPNLNPAQSPGEQQMDYSREQGEQILESYWIVGKAKCPQDGAWLTFECRRVGGGNYHLNANCPRCGAGKVMDCEFDRFRSTFRKWTAQDVASMVDTVFQHRAVICPACNSVHVKSPTAGRSKFVLDCARCGNMHVWTGDKTKT